MCLMTMNNAELVDLKMEATLFPDFETYVNTLPERMRIMLKMYGNYPGHQCGFCAHLKRYERGGLWKKCELTVQTGGAGTDWRARWPACGRFEEVKP